MNIQVSAKLFEELEEISHDMGVSVDTLVHLWLTDRLLEERIDENESDTPIS